MTSKQTPGPAWLLALVLCAAACGDDLTHVDEWPEDADPATRDEGLDASDSTGQRNDGGTRDATTRADGSTVLADGAVSQSGDSDASAGNPDGSGEPGSDVDASLGDAGVTPVESEPDAATPNQPDASDEPAVDASSDAATDDDTDEPDASVADASTPDPVGSIPKVFLPAGCGTAELVARDGTYLGLVSSGFGANSVCNKYGSFGNDSSPTSIFNKYGQYGSTYGINSAYNGNTTSPPAITCTSNKRVVAVVSKNKYAIAPAVIDPDVLCKALAASAL